MTSTLYYATAIALLIVGLIAIYIFARALFQIEHRITRLEKADELLTKNKAPSNHGKRGLEDAMALVVDLLIEDEADRARKETLLRYLQLLRDGRHDTEKPAREQ
jgi:hypothetical protein